MELFKLHGSIFVDTDKAEQSIQKTDDKAGKLAEKFGDGIKTAGKWGAAIATGAAAAVGGLAKVATNSMETADNIDKMSQRLGVTREAYQELDFVLSQSGVEVNSFQTGMKTLLAQMDKVSEGNKTAVANFDLLGVSVQNADGSLRTQEEVLNDTIAAFQGMENSAEKSRLAQELFGKQGQEILPLLNAEAGSFEAMKTQAHELGLVLSDDVIDSGVEMKDSLDATKRALEAVVTNLGGALMPLVTDASNFIQEHLPEIIGFVEDLRPALEKMFQTLVPVLMDMVMKILPPLLDLFIALEPAITVIAEIFTKVLIKAFELLGDVIVDVIDIVGKMKDVFTNVFGDLVEIVKVPMNAIISAINTVVDALNTLRFDVPDWVPGFGGKKFGFDIKHINYLADGGILTQPTFVGMNTVAGEAGPEAVIPLDKLSTYTGVNERTMEAILERVENIEENLGSILADALTTVSFKVDQREFGRLVREV